MASGPCTVVILGRIHGVNDAMGNRASDGLTGSLLIETVFDLRSPIQRVRNKDRSRLRKLPKGTAFSRKYRMPLPFLRLSQKLSVAKAGFLIKLQYPLCVN